MKKVIARKIEKVQMNLDKVRESSDECLNKFIF